MSWQVWINQRFDALRAGLGTRLAPEQAPVLQGSKVFDWPSVVDGANSSTTVTVVGALVGDFAIASSTVALPVGVILSASVTAADTVTVVLHNESGATQDLASATLRAMVLAR